MINYFYYYIIIYIYIQSIQKRLTFVVMYLRILNIKRAKNVGGNFHVNELRHKLKSLCWRAIFVAEILDLELKQVTLKFPP